MRIIAPPLGETLADKIAAVRRLEADGFAGAFLPSMGHDAMTVLALLWARAEEPRSLARRPAPAVLAAVVALVWRRLALGAWVGGYPAGGLEPAGVLAAAGVLAEASAPMLGLLGVMLVAGGASGGLAARTAFAGLACAVSGVLPLLPMLANGVLEPQNERWLLVGEMGRHITGQVLRVDGGQLMA